VVWIGCALSASATGATHACANPLIGVKADEPADHQAICDSAEGTLALFGRLDLGLSHPLVIEVAPNLPDWVNETAVGCYEEEE